MLSKYKFDWIRLELERPPSAPLQAPQIHRHLAPKSGMRIAPMAQCKLHHKKRSRAMQTAMLIEAGISYANTCDVRDYFRIAHAQPSACFSLTCKVSNKQGEWMGIG